MAYNVGFDDISRDPRDAARKSWGGWFFVLSQILGSIALFFGYSPITGQAETAGVVPGIVGLIAAGVAAVLAWRVRIGKGWLAGSALLVWWLGELLAKLIGGSLGILWIAIHLAAMASLVLGVRACWQLRGLSDEDVDLVATFE